MTIAIDNRLIIFRSLACAHQFEIALVKHTIVSTKAMMMMMKCNINIMTNVQNPIVVTRERESEPLSVVVDDECGGSSSSSSSSATIAELCDNFVLFTEQLEKFIITQTHTHTWFHFVFFFLFLRTSSSTIPVLPLCYKVLLLLLLNSNTRWKPGD